VAGGLTGILLIPVFFGQLTHPAVSWAPLLLLVAIVIGSAIRLGLVTVVCASFTARLLAISPLTFDPRHWAFDASVAVLLAIAGLAACTIPAARRGAPAGGLSTVR
jgi:hypothetical protein